MDDVLKKLEQLGTGATIEFVHEDVECKGEVKEVEWINEDEAVLYVCKCIYNGFKQPAVQEFSSSGISSLTLLEVVQDVAEVPCQQQVGLKDEVRKKDKPMVSNRAENRSDVGHLEKLRHLRIPQLLNQVQLRDPPQPKVLESQHGKPKVIPPPDQDRDFIEGDRYRPRCWEFETVRKRCWIDAKTPPKLNLPYKYYLIQTEELFHTCVEGLAEERVIGVCLEGQYLCRDGNLSIVSISTVDAVYLFDVLALGQQLCFEKQPRGSCNLRTMLEGDAMLKVFHDCRKPSDILSHKYNVRLKNVADTLVAHALFCCQTVFKGYLPKYSVSVAHLAKAYLAIGGDHLYFPHYRISYLKEDTKVWMERPLTTAMELNAVRNVAYLLEIHMFVKRALNSFHRDGVDVMLADVRDVDDADVTVKMLEDHPLPPSIELMLPNTVPDEKHVRAYVGMPEGRFVHQFNPQIDSNLIFSRDVMHQKRSGP